MHITLIQIGKTKFTYLQEGIHDYHKRILHYIDFKEITVPDLRNAGKLNIAEIKKKEGEKVMKLLRKTDFLILLDERGKQFNSEEFSGIIQKSINSGRDIVFLIGGAYGFSDGIYSRTNDQVSLSKMTFSHQIVRLIFAEQLYRAMTIIRGEPYHHA